MNCYRHSDVRAVGTCVACGKGLCAQCAVEVQKALACKDSCEPRVELFNKIMDSQAKVLSATKSQMKIMDILGATLGLVFFILAFYAYSLMGIFSAIILVIVGVLVEVQIIMRWRKKSRLPDIDV